MKPIDYSLYLVTGRSLLPPNKEYLDSLEESIKGGVTIVQFREKDLETQEFIRLASLTKDLCDKYEIPLIINDRVDVALAVGARGVHLGQSDMSAQQARKLLPPGSVIGVSCNNVGDVRKAVSDGVDYVGIGAVWNTKTKKLTSPAVGVRAVGEMLGELDGTKIKAVAIGGINSMNLLRTLHGAVSSTDHALDGIAVVSDIMASHEPEVASQRLRSIFTKFTPSILPMKVSQTRDDLLSTVCQLMQDVRENAPLIHQITNTVVQTQSANVTLAVGASPIMATELSEMEDLSGICDALLVNIGTMRAEFLDSMLLAGITANKHKKPIVLDPVGVGASRFRKQSVKALLDICQASVIKGNAGELAALAGTSEVKSKGVDSLGSGFENPVSFVRDLARRERCVVVLTGAKDYITDGVSVIELSNGDKVLGQITGSGCILGSCIASYCAAAAKADQHNNEARLLRGDMLTAAIAGVLVLTVAAEIAVERVDVRGPGTFLSGLIDELWHLAPDDILKRARLIVHCL